MNIKRWIARREKNWQELAVLLRTVEKQGWKSLSSREIETIASLYRATSADLARAKTNQVGVSIVRDLEDLTSRAYNLIYQGSRRQELSQLWLFFREGVPRVIQDNWVYIAISFGIFAIGAAIGWWYTWQDVDFISFVAPDELIRKVREDKELWQGSILGVEPTASSQITVNNLSVAFKMVGGGITAGLFTIYAMFMNGLHIGAVFAFVAQNGLGYGLLAFISSHGALELPAIFIAGGAGLLIARSILFPGIYRRRDALKVYGLEAAKLVFFVIPLLLVAGAIEGFISPQPSIPFGIKYLLGMIIFALLMTYVTRNVDRHNNDRPDWIATMND
jgi:uncharacterized membrane protein SpoIIM required for sporulation